MEVTETEIANCYIINPIVHKDNRGYFMESFNTLRYQSLIPNCPEFNQDNEAYSDYGVIRGLHMQQGSYPQAKLVRAIKGSILDVVVDLRKESPTYCKFISIILNDENKKQLLVPHGCLHGYSVLSRYALVSYKCDNYYHPPSEFAIRYDDPTFQINWLIPEEEQILSDKDKALPYFKTS